MIGEVHRNARHEHLARRQPKHAESPPILYSVDACKISYGDKPVGLVKRDNA